MRVTDVGRKLVLPIFRIAKNADVPLRRGRRGRREFLRKVKRYDIGKNSTELVFMSMK
jgi:hypothetical protein